MVSFSLNLTITGASSADGSSGAPVSTGNPLYNTITTPVQKLAFSSLLARYTVRPPWKVAGIDYPVGINASAVPLQSAATAALPANVTRSGTTWTLTGAAVIDGYDFSVGTGWEVDSNGFDLTIRNCYFKRGNNANLAIVGLCPNFDCQYNVFDNNSPAFTGIQNDNETDGFIAVNATVSYVLQYNYFLNGNAEYVVAGGAGAVNAPMTIQFNVFGPSGYGEGPTSGRIHGDIVQTYGGGTAGPMIVKYNTIFDEDNSGRPWGSQGFSMNSANAAACPQCPSLDCSNNTQCATPNVPGYTLGGGNSGHGWTGIALVNHSWFTNTITTNDNYMDIGDLAWSSFGVARWFYDYYPESNNGPGNPAFVSTGNIDMTTGSAQ